MAALLNERQNIKIILFCSAGAMLLLMAGILYPFLSQAFPGFNRGGHPDWIPLMRGTLSIACLSVIISFPFSIAVALFTGEYYKGTSLARCIRFILSLSRNIPSIVWGITAYYLMPGSGIFSISVVLAAMIIPYASALTVSCIAAVPQNLREGAYCLGATTTEVAGKIIFPAAKNGIMAAYLLSLGKALGETMIVAILAGKTITSTILLSNLSGLSSLSTLSTLAAGLFIITAAVNFIADYISRKTTL
jgi:phosphate transport system permease protein